MKDDKNFSVWDSNLFVRGDKEESHPVFLSMLDMMRERGWEVGSDPRIDRDYSLLSKDHYAGRKGDLLFIAEKYNTGAKIEFYQEINVVNQSGGRYDFDKFNKMPYLIQKRFLVERKHIEKFLLEQGCERDSDPELKTSYDKVFHKLNESSRHWRSDNIPDYNALDKDGVRISNGEVKYFRDRKGVLMRGTVYHNINNMWWVIINKDHYTNLAAFELFSLNSVPENSIRKLIRRSGHNNPKSRFVPTEEQLKDWKRKARQAGREGRVRFANTILEYLYEINWVSRKFQLVIKETNRLGLIETEGNPYFLGTRTGERKYDPPKVIPLYPKPQQMSGTESGWVENLRDYVSHGKPTVSRWFCKDRNGEGGRAYLWPEVRERLLMIGAHV